MGNISIVIGSWGSYNECNERALGSKWLDLSDYSDWEEIVEELKREGFELNGIDEELFIQDIEGIYDRSVNWDYMNPENLFNTLYESGVLTNDYKYKELCAFLEVKNYDDFEELVKNRGENWDDILIRDCFLFVIVQPFFMEKFIGFNEMPCCYGNNIIFIQSDNII